MPGTSTGTNARAIDSSDRALPDRVDELRLHHPVFSDFADRHAFTLEVCSVKGRYPGVEVANCRPAVVMVTRDVRRDNEPRERMSAASPAHGVCSGIDEVGGSQRCARAARGYP